LKQDQALALNRHSRLQQCQHIACNFKRHRVIARPSSDLARLIWAAEASRINSARFYKESEMPKLKTKSGAKKRFKLTASGKVKHGVVGKRHGMIKRTTKQVRQNRRTGVLSEHNLAKVVKTLMPYA
jgi:large subunit ribosomal protein L35